jgi:hypothetical protein
VAKERSFFGQFFFGSNPSRAEREEEVLRYVIHRIYQDVPLHNVFPEEYVQRNCSQVEIDQIAANPEFVHAAREIMERAFGWGELALWHQHLTSEEGS